MRGQSIANQAQAVGRRVPKDYNPHALFADALRHLKVAQ
jgi:hypothetical protein